MSSPLFRNHIPFQPLNDRASFQPSPSSKPNNMRLSPIAFPDDESRMGDRSSTSPVPLRRSARTVMKPRNNFLIAGSSQKIRKKMTEFEKLMQNEERREKKGFAAASATAETLVKRKGADDSDNESPVPVTRSRKQFSSRAPSTPVRFNGRVSMPADSGSDDEESRQREIELRQRVVNKYIPNADSGALSAILTSDVMMGQKGSDSPVGSRRFWRKQKHHDAVATEVGDLTFGIGMPY